MKIVIKILLYFSLSAGLVAAEVPSFLNGMSADANNYLLVSDDPIYGAVLDTTAVSAGIAVWGITQWEWGTKSLHAQREGWFEQSSSTGGSDKTGHFFMTYMLSRIMASRMQDRGLSLEEASLTGSLLGIGAMTFLEIGDGTSDYGFSHEDFIANSLGAILAYFIRAYPKVDEFIDIRFEYFPKHKNEGRNDLTTDYSNMRHLVAFKPSGFDTIKKTPLSLIEFQVGFYSRGFRSYDTIEKNQHLYVGIGLSLSDLARRSDINVLKNVFEFYQPGGTYVEADLWKR